MRNQTLFNIGLSLCATINAFYPGAVVAQAEAEPPPPQQTTVGKVFASTDVDFSHPYQHIDFFTQQQTHVRRHLIIAGTPGVQLLTGLADALGECRLDVHVHVFEPCRPAEAAGLDVGADGT